MAASVVYTNFAGQIAVENRGGTVKEYIPDTLGSTVALAGTMSITDTWDYWPYGEVMTRTGSTPTPFTFVGVLGYFKDLLDKLFYVRARHYQPNYGRWLTVDPLWPREAIYCYALIRPASNVDPSGLSGILGLGSIAKDWVVRGGKWLIRECADVVATGVDVLWTCAGDLSSGFAGGYQCYDPCFDCAQTLGSRWFFDAPHWIDHKYAHCMFCCALTRGHGEKCALDSQNWQNTHWPLRKTDEIGRERMKYCKIGIDLGKKKGSCHQLCSSKLHYSGPPLAKPALSHCLDNPRNPS